MSYLLFVIYCLSTVWFSSWLWWLLLLFHTVNVSAYLYNRQRINNWFSPDFSLQDVLMIDPLKHQLLINHHTFLLLPSSRVNFWGCDLHLANITNVQFKQTSLDETKTLFLWRDMLNPEQYRLLLRVIAQLRTK